MPMIKTSSHCHGYSLLELVCALAITATLGSLFIQPLAKAIRAHIIRLSSEQLAADLNRARTAAQALQQVIYFDVDAHHYSIKVGKTTAGSSAAVEEQIMQQITLPAHIRISGRTLNAVSISKKAILFWPSGVASASSLYLEDNSGSLCRVVIPTRANARSECNIK